MAIKVESSNDPLRPIALWWTNHGWSDITVPEAVYLLHQLDTHIRRVLKEGTKEEFEEGLKKAGMWDTFR